MHLKIKNTTNMQTPDGVEHPDAVIYCVGVVDYWHEHRLQVFCDYFHSLQAAQANAHPLEGAGLRRFVFEFNGSTAVTYQQARAALYLDADGVLQTHDEHLGDWVLAQPEEAVAGQPFGTYWDFVVN